MNAIKTIIFDVGNVLISVDHERARRQLGELCGFDPDEVRDHFLRSGLLWDYEAGRVTTEELVAKVSKLVGKTVTRSELSAATCPIFSEIPETNKILGWLRTQDYGLWILSNTNELHWEYIEDNYNFPSQFDGKILSFQQGTIKPEAAIYQKALTAIGVPANQCVFIDDLQDNVKGANTAGIDAILFQTPASLVKELSGRGIDVPETVWSS